MNLGMQLKGLVQNFARPEYINLQSTYSSLRRCRKRQLYSRSTSISSIMMRFIIRMKTIFQNPVLPSYKYRSLHNNCLALSLLQFSDHASSFSDSHNRQLSTPRPNLQPCLIIRVILRITHISRLVSHIINTNPKVITFPIPNPNPLPHLIVQRQCKTPH